MLDHYVSENPAAWRTWAAIEACTGITMGFGLPAPPAATAELCAPRIGGRVALESVQLGIPMRRHSSCFLCAMLSVVACGGRSELDGGSLSASVGGTASVGGSERSGGSPAFGGTTLTTRLPYNSGGFVATGGRMIVATGGHWNTGGAIATGGWPATGGVLHTGGTRSTGGTFGSGGLMATGGTTSTCASDSDCTYCAFPFAPTSTVLCPCPDCERSAMTKADCAFNTVAWNTYCIDTCDNNAIACGPPASLPLCINGVCTAQLGTGGAGGAGGSSSTGGTTATGGMAAATGGAIASGGTSSNGTVATDAGDAGETYTLTLLPHCHVPTPR